MKHAWSPGHFTVHVGLSCEDVFIGILCCIISCHLRLTLLQPCVSLFMCNLMSSLSHRLKEQKNLNSFFAVMFGLGNSAVHRLHKTWEVRKSPNSKFTIVVNVVLPFLQITIPENPQQDKKNLLCLREVDGKRSCLALFLYNVMYFPKNVQVMMLFLFFFHSL